MPVQANKGCRRRKESSAFKLVTTLTVSNQDACRAIPRPFKLHDAVDISNRLKESEIRNILVDHLTAVPNDLNQILNFHEAMRDAIVSAKPIDFDGILKKFREELKYPEDGYRDSTMEADGAERAARRIINMINDQLMWKLDRATAYETKVEAISTLVTMITDITAIPDKGFSEWSDGFRTGALPRAICQALWKILEDHEVDRFAQENEPMISAVESAQSKELHGCYPWKRLSDFLSLMPKKLPQTPPQQTSPMHSS
ncbi:uncharacterized protein PAC_11789 [Phialocephala subalpina]|uniref:Uncharacterized protein n=1 Tax=Phialocephala subalpina TaxID=576137 RepID=A0A1L7XA53_9HELO|nr:uncharacterized protein PAC_11789 [Phialocephala subalpina]